MRDSTENIPRELLGDIFLLALTYTPREWTPNLYISRSRLTGVCRSWRNVSISDPRLWTTIALEEPDFKLPTLSFLRLCIERSSNFPLSIHLIGAFEENQWLNPPLFDLTQVIGAEIHRWKSFTCVAHTYTFTPLQTLADLQFNFPSARQLRYIKIDIDQQDLDSDRSLYDFYAELSHLPDLREVSICAPDIFDASPSNPSREILTSTRTTESWASFTRLELTSFMVWRDVVFLLKHCSNVKLLRIKLRQLEYYRTPHPIQERLYLTQNTLRALHINFSFFAEDFSPLLDAVTLPHLEVFQYEDFETLEANFHGGDPALHWNNFLKMISHSLHLQVLIISHSAFGPEQLLEFISHTVVTRIPTVQMLIDVDKLENDLSSGNDSRDFYSSLIDQGPDDLVQAALLDQRGRSFLVGWVEAWVNLKEIVGVGTLADGGFVLHPVLERASCVL